MHSITVSEFSNGFFELPPFQAREAIVVWHYAYVITRSWMPIMPVPGNQWLLSSSHGTLLFHIAANPECTTKDIANAMCLTRRSVWGGIGDLRRAGMLRIRRNGRRHYYTVNLDAPFPHPTIRGVTLHHILDQVVRHAPSSREAQLDAHGGQL